MIYHAGGVKLTQASTRSSKDYALGSGERTWSSTSRMILDGEVGGSYDVSKAARNPLDYMQYKAEEVLAAQSQGSTSVSPTPVIMYQTHGQPWEASSSTVRSAAEASWWKQVHGDLKPPPCRHEPSTRWRRCSTHGRKAQWHMQNVSCSRLLGRRTQYHIS